MRFVCRFRGMPIWGESPPDPPPAFVLFQLLRGNADEPEEPKAREDERDGC
jgi:hypothetical protein